MARASDLIWGTLTVPTDGEVPYYPELVAGFEAIGFRRLGGLLAELTDERVEEIVGWYEPELQEEVRRSARTPESVLAAPDGSAFVGVDWFFGMPSVRIRALLADGRLVETQRAWDRLPSQIREMAPHVARLRLRPEQDRSAAGRLVTLVEDANPASLWSAHQEAVARTEETPVRHLTIQQARALWRACFLHDMRIALRVGPASKAALYALQVIAFTVIAAFLLLGHPWWAVGTAAVGAVLALVLAYRLTWWLRYARWLRPRFQAP